MLTVRFEAIPCYLIMRVKVKVAQFCTDSLSVTPRTIHSPWNSPGQKTGVGSCSLLQGIFPTQGSNCRSPALQADSLPAEPQGKPKNTGVGSPSLLQWVFLTQELNQGLLHCKQILYKPSFKGSPIVFTSWETTTGIPQRYCAFSSRQLQKREYQNKVSLMWGLPWRSSG